MFLSQNMGIQDFIYPQNIIYVIVYYALNKFTDDFYGAREAAHEAGKSISNEYKRIINRIVSAVGHI